MSGLSTLTEELLSFTISGGRFLVTGNDCAANSNHNAFYHAKNNGQCLCVIGTRAEFLDFWVTGTSHNIVDISR